MVISQRDNPKTWEGKTTMWTEMGVTDGETVTLWKVKHPEFEKGIREALPKMLTQVTVRVTYCSTEKGNTVVQGVLIS